MTISQLSNVIRFPREATSEVTAMQHDDSILIRAATTDDLPALDRLSALDDSHRPDGDVLLGFVDGELRAAVPVGGGTPVADPFHLTADLVELLRVRSRSAA
jgi:hypothetical protein